MLAVSLVTLGSPTKLTGGYLYHQRMAEAAGDHDVALEFVSFPDHRFPLPAAWGWSVLRAARAADVILVDSIAAAYLAPVVRAHRRRQPIAVVAHQPPGGIDHGAVRTRLQAMLDRSLYRCATCVIAASESLAAELGAGDIRVVPPGCDVGVADDVLPDLRQGRRAAFLCVGNWVERKGILELVEAFARIPEDSATLHLAGRFDVDAEYAARVAGRLALAHLEDRLVIHGPVSSDRVATLLRAADVFVLPSVREPYGTVYGEALAAGVPVVGWRAGNLPHLAEDGKQGVILPPGDVEGLATALERLATDEPYREALRQGAEQRGRSLPTWAQSAEQFFAIVRELAGTAR